MKTSGCLFGLMLGVHALLAQAPRIEKVIPAVSHPTSTIEIVGSGFSASPADLVVWFGNVRGTIISSSATSIFVTVPPQARLSEVEVIHKQNWRSAKSPLKFMPTFLGRDPFQPSFSKFTRSSAEELNDLCTCDINNDGKPDFVATKLLDGATTLAVMLNQSTVSANNSTISFAATTTKLIGYPTFNIACGDLNGDGFPEIVASRGGQTTVNSVFIVHNNNGSLGDVIQLDLAGAGDFAREVAIRDLNGDGKPEIIVTNSQNNTMYIFENKLTGLTITKEAFTIIPRAVTALTNTHALEVQDFNGDGWPDIAVAAIGTNKISILINPANGSLNFTTTTNFSVSGAVNIYDLASADFNNDGKLDLLITDQSVSVNKLFVLINNYPVFSSVNGTTGFPNPSAYGADVADMNGDGYPDFVAASRSATPQLNIYINNRAATPGFTPYNYTTDLLFPSRYVKLGDYDGDGKPDIAAVMRGLGAFAIDVYKNKNCHQPKILNGSEVRICTGQSVTLEAVPMPGVAFSWSTGATGPTATVTSANAGTVTLTATGEGGACSVQTTITVIGGDGAAPAKPTISGPDGVCSGSSIILTTASVAGSPTYIWSGPNNFNVETSTPSVTVTSNANASYSGTYQLTIKVSNCLSTASDPKTVTVVEPSSFSISGNSGVCSGQSVTLSVSPVAGYTYQWKKGANNIAGATGPSHTINPVSVSDAGSYTVNIAHQTVLNCSRETSPFTLQVLTAPVAVISTTPPLNQVCVGTEVTFSASGSTVDNAATVNYAWDFGNGATGSGATASHIYQTARVSTIASLTISYSGSGCSSNVSTTSFAVSSAIAPVITTEPQVSEICGNGSESVTLNVTGSYESYTWNTNATGPSLVVKTPGTYRVNTLDANACSGTSEIVLASKPGCEAGSVPAIEITVPKVFTPNDDGSNDFWLIEGLEEYPDCMMSVFDGRGRRVFEASGSVLLNSPWDGRAAGGPVPDGTYFYVFGCPDGARATGSVLIVR